MRCGAPSTLGLVNHLSVQPRFLLCAFCAWLTAFFLCHKIIEQAFVWLLFLQTSPLWSVAFMKELGKSYAIKVKTLRPIEHCNGKFGEFFAGQLIHKANRVRICKSQ